MAGVQLAGWLCRSPSLQDLVCILSSGSISASVDMGKPTDLRLPRQWAPRSRAVSGGIFGFAFDKLRIGFMPPKSFLSFIHGPQDLGGTIMAEHNFAMFDHGKISTCWGEETSLPPA